ncbi:MAG TPA: hypothetical protein VIY27_11685, partial [Myxococcota bacterium]
MRRFGALPGVGLLLFAALPTAAASQPEQIDPAQSCASGECHEEIGELSHLHWEKMTEPGQCQRCHVPEDDLHVFETAEGPDACFGCHEALAARMSGGGALHPAA